MVIPAESIAMVMVIVMVTMTEVGMMVCSR